MRCFFKPEIEFVTSKIVIALLVLAVVVAVQAMAQEKSGQPIPGDDRTSGFGKSTCAILTFDAKGGISAEECSLLTDRFMVEFDEIGHFTLLPRTKMNEVLKMQEFSRSENCSATDCAIEAGKLLSVQFIIYGSVGKFGSMYTLNTFMVNVESGATAKRATTDHEGRLEDLLKLAMAQNARQLLGLSTDRETRSVTPVVVQPAPNRVVDVQPVRTVVVEEPDDQSEAGKAQQQLPEDLKKGLVVYYTFDKDEGGKVKDQSGKGNDGQVNGAKWIRGGEVGGAFSFNGDGNTVDIRPNCLDNIGDATFSFWVKANRSVAYDAMVFSHYVNDDNGLDARIAGYGMQVCVGKDRNGDGPGFSVLDYGRWTHVVAVLGGGGGKLYINGQLKAEKADCKWSFKDLGRSVASTIGRTWLTRPHNGGPCWFKGKLDEFMIYDRALSEKEIKQIWGLQATDAMQGTKPAVDLKKGLVLHYSFDKDEGGKVTDLSGNGHDGEVHGAKWLAKGKIGGAYGFDGSGATFIDAGTSLDISKNFTIVIWVYAKTFDSIRSIISKDTNDLGFSLERAMSSGLPTFCFYDGSWRFVVFRHQPALNDWSCFVLTHDGSFMRGYFNGALDSDVVPALGIVQKNAALYIGRHAAADAARNWNGLIDEVLIYDRALSGEEVEQLHGLQRDDGVNAVQNKGPVDLKDGLVLQYSFDKDEGGKVTDISGNGHSGEVHGAKWIAKGKIGGGYVFDGDRDYIDLGIFPELDFNASTSWTYAFWMSPGGSLGNMAFFGRWGNNNNYDGGENYLYYQKGRVSPDIDGISWGAVNGEWDSGAILEPDQWQHVVVMYDASIKRASIYVNGTEKSSVSVSSMGSSSGPMRIGYNANISFFKGVMDEVMIYNRALSEKEIKQIWGLQATDAMQGTKPAVDLKKGLVLQYSFDRDEGGKVTDNSGRKNNGEAKGAKWTQKGRIGGAYVFAGGTDHILVDSQDLRKSSNDSFSLALWFCMEKVNPNDENCIIGLSGPRGLNDGTFGYRIGTGRANGQGSDCVVGFIQGACCRDNSVYPQVLGIKEKQWYHAVGVYDKGDIILYVDGREQGRARYSLGSTQASTSLLGCIGNSYGSVETRGFNGIIDEVMVYDRALSADEVKQIYEIRK